MLIYFERNIIIRNSKHLYIAKNRILHPLSKNCPGYATPIAIDIIAKLQNGTKLTGRLIKY
jgi:hypothetical protein